MRRTWMRRSMRAFTLIELMLVMVILATLAAIIVPRFTARGKEAKITQAKVQIGNFETAISVYEVDNGQYPATEEGLKALSEAPAGLTNWKGPYLEKGIPNDPWGNPYVYTCPGVNNVNGYDIHSFGPDGQDGTDDDIVNWTK
jgi:general secretion pathway protein G